VDSPEREIPTPSRSVRNSAIFTIRSSIPASSATIRSMTHPSGAVRPPVERAIWITHAFRCRSASVLWASWLGALVPWCLGAFAHPHAVVARAPQTDPRNFVFQRCSDSHADAARKPRRYSSNRSTDRGNSFASERARSEAC
jgi:hypothetical protein